MMAQNATTENSILSGDIVQTMIWNILKVSEKDLENWHIFIIPSEFEKKLLGRSGAMLVGRRRNKIQSKQTKQHTYPIFFIN